MQMALMQMNLQLHHVVSDITGKTGMWIIRAILDSIHYPITLRWLSRRTLQGLGADHCPGTGRQLPG